MITSVNCSHCKNDFPLSMQRCPHCGLPGHFPNVTIALSEQKFLQERYDNAKNEALSRKVLTNVNDFETALSKSCAVINRSLNELLRLIGSEFEGYATYYQLASSTVRIQSGEIWDSRRQAADAIFFTNYQHEIRFASLALDSIGLSNYGDCSWIFRENMIAHRASVFEENTTLYYMNNDIKDAADVPEGYRAIWNDRAKLCIAKLAQKIDTTTIPAQYSDILMHQGATSAEDEIVEVHIFGSMTIRTIEEVTFNPVPNTISKRERIMKLGMIEGIKEKLGKYGVKVN